MLDDFKDIVKRKNITLTSSSREDLVSMILGLVIVGVVVGLIFNFVQRKKGNVSVPGISSQISLTDSITIVPTVTEFEEETEKSIYVVKKGDSLWDISVNIYGNGYKWGEIAKQNNLVNADFLIIGQELSLLPVESSPAPSGEYVVKSGDSLWKISVNLYSDGFKWVDIWNQNRELIANPNLIEVGTKLALP